MQPLSLNTYTKAMLNKQISQSLWGAFSKSFNWDTRSATGITGGLSESELVRMCVFSPFGSKEPSEPANHANFRKAWLRCKMALSLMYRKKNEPKTKSNQPKLHENTRQGQNMLHLNDRYALFTSKWHGKVESIYFHGTKGKQLRGQYTRRMSSLYAVSVHHLNSKIENYSKVLTSFHPQVFTQTNK